MWIGSFRQNTETPLGLKWCNSVKALGITFTYNEVDLLQRNVCDKLKDIRKQTRLWSCRGLSLYGKVTIIKSLLIPKMLYAFSILPTSEHFIKQLNLVINSFFYGKGSYLSNTPTNLCIALLNFLLFCFILYCYAFVQYCYVK